MAEQYANFGTQTLITGLAGTSTATTWFVSTNVGYPASVPFRVTIDNEILVCTASTMASGTFTMSGSRGQESTTVTTHSSGVTALHALTTGAMNQIIADNVTLTSFSGKAAASKAGRVQLYNDVPNIARDNGATLDPFGPIYPFSDPTTPSFSWRNQGSASISTSGQTLFLAAPAAAASDGKGREITAPGTPYSITCAFVPEAYTGNFQTFGMYFADSTSSKCVSMNYVSFGNYILRVDYLTTISTYSSTPYTHGTVNYIPSPVWFKLQDTGTNFVFSVSVNGANFSALTTLTRTAHLASPDRVGFFVNSGASNFPISMAVHSWAQGT